MLESNEKHVVFTGEVKPLVLYNYKMMKMMKSFKGEDKIYNHHKEEKPCYT